MASVAHSDRRAAGGVPGGGSGAVTEPAGILGSKNPSGLGRLATSSMFQAAWPPSWKPGLSPMRGSFGLGAGCCAETARTAVMAIAKTLNNFLIELSTGTPKGVPYDHC